MAGKIRALLFLGVTGMALALSGCDSGSSCHAQDVFFSWRLVKDVNNAPLTCEQAAATRVFINMDGMVFDFPCSAYAGSVRNVPVGTYATAFQVQDVNGQVLSQTPTMTVAVSSCRSVNIGVVEFGTP